MKLALVEPNLSGHHIVYLDTFYKTLSTLGHSVEIYTTAKTDKPHKIIKYTNTHTLPKLSVYKKVIVLINFFITLKNIYSLKKCLSKDIDLVFFCCMDDYMNEFISQKVFDILFPFHFSGLFLSPRNNGKYFHLDRKNILRSEHCDSIAILDEFCFPLLNKYHSHIVRFPDFTDTSLPNLQYELGNYILEKAKGRKIISLLGAINARKGIHTFIKAAQKMPVDTYYFVMAGKAFIDKDEQNYILQNFANRSNCLYMGDAIPTESDFNRLVQLSSVIYAAYVHFSQSSNMFAKAALFEKPVIVSKGYYMEEVIKHYSIGIAIQQDSEIECINAILYLSTDFIAKKNYQNYLAKNSQDNLFSSFNELLSYSQK